LAELGEENHSQQKEGPGQEEAEEPPEARESGEMEVRV
jgi:hypothetical protein